MQRLIKSGTLQAKLKIGQLGDKYEQEADRVADAVMRMPEPGVQRQVEPEEEEEETLQAKPLANQITPLVHVQRQEEPEEEEEETLNAKPLAEEITPLVQMQVEPEEEEEELQRQPIEEEEEELQAKVTSGHISHENPNLESHIQSLRGGGHPLSENNRTFFEPRFNRNLSHVRIHTDSQASKSANVLNARAFTMGNDIVFGEVQYVPGTHEGQKLLAHELSHVVQQKEVGIQQLIQRKCASLRSNFSLVSNSGLGKSINNALSGETEVIPDPLNKGKSIQKVRVNPVQVIEILNSSNCFKHNAQTVEKKFFGGKSPKLTVEAFDPRSEKERRSQFVPGSPSIIHVGVASNLADAVQIIVHEVVHATPVKNRFQGSKIQKRKGRPLTRVEMKKMARYAGAVTKAERRRVREEALTRDREAEIMEEIRNNDAWKSRTGGAKPRAISYQPEDVRGSFISGLPKLTYQEFFIIEAMKKRYRSALGKMDEREVHSAARGMVGEGGFTLKSASIKTTKKKITHHRKSARLTPVFPPPLPAARECIVIYNRYRRSLDKARTKLMKRHENCPSFIEKFRRNLEKGLDVSTARGKETVYSLHEKMRLDYQVKTSLHRTGDYFITWYDKWHSGLSPKDQRNKTLQTEMLHFFEWVVIAEKMSSNWGSNSKPDPVIRRKNLEFLVSAAGGKKKGELTGKDKLLTGIPYPPKQGKQ